jgi:hypothetical protein
MHGGEFALGYLIPGENASFVFVDKPGRAGSFAFESIVTLLVVGVCAVAFEPGVVLGL